MCHAFVTCWVCDDIVTREPLAALSRRPQNDGFPIMSKILVVDDEKDIVDLVAFHLERAGHEVVSVNDGMAVAPIAVKESPHLIVLDVMLPGMDGLQVQRMLRTDTRTRHIPVIMLTARAQVNDRIAGLESGVDDYLTKPFSPRELVLRIDAVLRRSKKATMVDEERIGDFVIDRRNMALTVDSKLVDLTTTELKLMATLMANPDVVHTRAELLSAVWGYADDTQSRTLDTHIKRLRDKLGVHGAHIGTSRKLGYLFITQVAAEQVA